jgi:microcin C transport system permease protein
MKNMMRLLIQGLWQKPILKGWIKLCIALFLICGLAPLWMNNKPLVIVYKSKIFFPASFYYPETEFGGEFDIEADYKSEEFQVFEQKKADFVIWPLICFGPEETDFSLEQNPPTPMDRLHLLGTDDQGRDLLVRLVFSVRNSLFFAILLALSSTGIAMVLGAIQGYFGGWIDLGLQRLTEIWSGLPMLLLLMVLSRLFEPGMLGLLGLCSLFFWTSLVGWIRADFLKYKNMPYVQAAIVLGAPPKRVIFKHILPHTLLSCFSFFPFLVYQGMSFLMALDFLGFGLRVGEPSFGELFHQARNNLHAPWVGGFTLSISALILMMLVFLGQGIRDLLEEQEKR